MKTVEKVEKRFSLFSTNSDQGTFYNTTYYLNFLVLIDKFSSNSELESIGKSL